MSAACSACGRRSTHRATRATTRGSSPSSRGASGTTGVSRPPRRSGTSADRSRRCTAGCGTTGWRHCAGCSGRAPTRRPGSQFLHGRLWADPVEGPLAPFSVVEAKPPFEALDADYPIRLTTGRRLESFDTGAQSNRYRSPLHRGESSRPLTGGRGTPRDRRRRDRACLVEARLGGGTRADRPVPPRRARLHDVPLPGRGRRQPAHDRRDRSEVGNGRVQGRRSPRRQARALRARAARGRREPTEATEATV